LARERYLWPVCLLIYGKVMKRVIVVVMVCLLSLVTYYEIPMETSAHNEKTITVTFINNDQFIIDDGIGPVIYTDVIQEPDISDPDPDIILITHDHFDHFDPVIVEQLANSYGATVVGPNFVIDALEGSVPLGQLIRMDPLLYERMNQTIQGIEIFAYHGSVDNNSYRFTVGGGVVSLYHSGDNMQDDFAQYISNGYSELYNLDIAMLANWFNIDSFNSSYHPNVMIEMHFGDHCDVYENYPELPIQLYSEDSWYYQHIPIIDVKSGTTPSIDGVISPGEWDDADSFMFFNDQGEIRIYFKHDDSSLYFMSDIVDSTYYWGDDIVIGIDTEHNGGTSPQSDDYQFYIMREVTNSEIRRGTGSGWESVPVNEWAGHVINETSSNATTWIAEISISYAFLNIVDGEQIMGIELRSYDNDPQDWYNWPADGLEDDPMTWANMQSSDKWGLEDTSNILYVGGSNPGNYTHIQMAIDNASDGDTVFVYDDSAPYYENVIVDKSINLIGENKETTIINSSGTGEDVIRITSDWVNVSGFTTLNGHWGISISESDNITISNNIISLSEIYGISLWRSSNVSVSRNKVYGNYVGIRLSTCVNNTITENNVSYNRDGMWIMASSFNNITSNIVNFSFDEGLLLSHASNNFIARNKINYNDRGINIEMDSHNNSVKNNTFTGNRDSIRLSTTQYTNVSNNTISSNENIGIHISGSGYTTIIGNNFTNAGIYISGTELSRYNSHTIPSSNKINGRPIYYYKNQNSMEIDGDLLEVGQIILANCKDVVMKNTHIMEAYMAVIGAFSENVLIHNCNLSENIKDGILFYNTSDSTIADNEIYNNDEGMTIQKSSFVKIIRNNVSLNTGYGIFSQWSSNINISENNLTQNNNYAIQSGFSYNNTVINNKVYDHRNGILFVFSSNLSAHGNNISKNDIYGIDMSSVSYVNITNNSVSNNDMGIRVRGTSSHINITGNIVSENNAHGIHIYGIIPSNITNNFINNNENGIYLRSASGNLITDNEIHSNDNHGIYLETSSENEMLRNNVSSNGNYGFEIKHQSNDNVISENSILNSQMRSINVEDSSDGNSIINNKISGDWSQKGISLLQSSSTHIENNTVSKTSDGISLNNSDYNIITANNVSLNTVGFHILDFSSYNDVNTNIISFNERGLWLKSSSRNNMIGNNITSNSNYGIHLVSSSYNHILENNVSESNNGIYLESNAMHNKIYNNNIMANSNQAYDDTDNRNEWNNSYPYGGNYWSDYTGSDEYYGPEQDQPGSDDIGDTNYTIDSDSFDHYPLMQPFGNTTPPGPVYNIDKNTYHDLIQDAVDNADSGNRIYVSSGIFYENVQINKTINLVGEDKNSTVIDGGGNGDVVLIEAAWVNITGFTINNSGALSDDEGLDIISNNTYIHGNNIVENRRGMSISSGKNIIKNNLISISEDHGIYMTSSNENVITSNNFSFNGGTGLFLSSSNGNNINDNIFLDNEYGLSSYESGINLQSFSNENSINGNTVFSNDIGISLLLSSGNNIMNNNASSGNQRGIMLQNSNGNNITKNDILYNEGVGVQLQSSNDNNITDNDVSLNDLDGIYLDSSTGNSILGNTIHSNFNRGMQIYDSDNNNISYNAVTFSIDVGLYIRTSNNNIFIGNDISYNPNGLYLQLSSNNRFYHNNIIDNTNQASDNGGNIWDNGYPSGGNYWSDYIGMDEYSGVNQDQPGSDGIGDTSYDIDFDSIDNYPLMVPHGGTSGPVHNVDKDIYYYKIQDAIDDADFGNSILVSSGTYLENILVTQTITLTGEDKNTTVINGSGNGDVVHILSDRVNITGFTITNSGDAVSDAGIHIDSNNNAVFNNIITSTNWGIYIIQADDNTISNNEITLNNHGIFLSSSAGATIISNFMIDNGIAIDGNEITHWNTHEIDASNTVNNKPVYYWKNQTGGVVPQGAGQVILANCMNVKIENQILTHGSVGIELGFSSNNEIIGNNASFNTFTGIILTQSSGNLIQDNNASYGYVGLYVSSSSDNNDISDNGFNFNLDAGIISWSSSDNSITANNISNNLNGIYLFSSSNNQIYHNNIIDNTYQATDDVGSNYWDNNYPSGGNHWGDYTGSDQYSGPNQDEQGKDGIGDTPYTDINGGAGAQDNYPLMIPYGAVVGSVYNIDTSKYFSTIQEAIDDPDTLNGHTIEVAVGTYNENIIVDKTITLIGEDRDTTTINGGGSGNDDVIMITANWVNITGFTVTKTGLNGEDAGIELNNVNNCTINNIKAYNNWYGILLWYANENDISDNNASSNRDTGIFLEYSNMNTITSNHAVGNDFGIYIYYSNFNDIAHNDVSYSEHSGIQLSSSEGITIDSNTMIGDGIGLYGILLVHWNTHDIDTSNTINGKPVYYWKNQDGGSIPSNAGQIILANCTDVVIENLELSEVNIAIQLGFSTLNSIKDNEVTQTSGRGISLYQSDGNSLNHNIVTNNHRYGIFLFQSHDNEISDNIAINNNEGIFLQVSHGNNITDNNASSNYFGIFLSSSQGNNVTGCMASSNFEEGMILWYSDGNNITDCNISHNNGGVYLRYSNGNTITGTTFFSNNGMGLLLLYSEGNMIHHNNFIDNAYQASDNSDGNNWDDGYPSGGNFWTDYLGVDEKSGSDQDLDGSDGIGDIPYTDIFGDSGAQDNYPFVTDIIPPTIQLIFPLNNSVIKSNTLINFSVSDRNLYQVTYSINGDPYQSFTSPFFLDTKDWSNGNHTVEIQATDTNNNMNSRWFNFTLDSILPTIDLISPNNNTIIQAGILLNLSISDVNLKDVICSVNNGADFGLTQPYNIDTRSWNDGDYNITVNTSDLAGNFVLNWFNFTIDSTSPEIILVSPTNDSIIKSDFEIMFTITDTYLNQVSYSVNGGTTKSFSEPYNIDVSSWPDGHYNIEINADDIAGNINEKSFTFIIDTSPPEITLNSPENNTLLMEDSILDFEIADENLNSVSYSINHGFFKNFEEPFDLDTSTWEDGEYVITIKAQDNASHIMEQWYAFRIDTEIPSIASTFPEIDASDINVEVKVTIDFSESMDTISVESAISISPFTEYSLSWENDNSTLTINFTDPLAYNTLYQISISTEAQDISGRKLQDKYELEFTTQTTPKEENGDEFPVIYLILMALIAVIVTAIIVMSIVSKKKKALAGDAGKKLPESTSPSQAIQFTCSNCNNLLQAIDNGTTQNVTCPYCSSQLTVPSQKAAEEISQVQAQSQSPQPTKQIGCPQCKQPFNVINTGGSLHVQCPNCGATGTINLGGNIPATTPGPVAPQTPSIPPQQIRCPGCQQIFGVETTIRPVSIQCPHCGMAGTLN
jgi:parallel beta-helix repeat protein